MIVSDQDPRSKKALSKPQKRLNNYSFITQRTAISSSSFRGKQMIFRELNTKAPFSTCLARFSMD